MNKVCDFSVRKTKLVETLKQFRRLQKVSRHSSFTLEVTIIDNYVQLVAPGIELQIPAITSGSAKFTIGLDYFFKIAEPRIERELNFTLAGYDLSIGALTISVQSTFFETDKILRSIDLPFNYTYLDIAALFLSDKYTEEEIVFNNLDIELEAAIKKVKKDIHNAKLVMQNFGFTKKEVAALILNKLKEGGK